MNIGGCMDQKVMQVAASQTRSRVPNDTSPTPFTLARRKP
jgi:hypothetical protein